MKRHFSWWPASLWLLSASATCTAAPDFGTHPVSLVADNWCPQHCQSDRRYKGYIVEIVSQALQIEGVPFNIVYRPWLRALRETEQGRFDGLLTPTVIGYPQFNYHRVPVGYQQYCFYTKADSQWQYKKPSDLQGKRVAHLKESGFGALDAYLAANRKTIQVQEFAGSNDVSGRMFDFLGANRTDMVIMTTDVYDFAKRTGGMHGAFKRAGCLANEALAVGLSKSDPKRALWIAARLDSGIGKLRQSGQLKNILDEYGIRAELASKR